MEYMQKYAVQPTLIMLYPYVSHKPIEFECEAEYVVMVRGVPHYEAAVRLSGQDTLSGLARQRAPIPTMLKHV